MIKPRYEYFKCNCEKGNNPYKKMDLELSEIIIGKVTIEKEYIQA